MRYTDRPSEAGIAPSVGSRGDSYDNALAESIIGLFKTEVIQRKGPWRHRDAVEFAMLAWVDLSWRDLQRELKSHAQTRQIPIVVVTGNDASDLHNADIVCVLRKPLDAETLALTVDDACGNRDGTR